MLSMLLAAADIDPVWGFIFFAIMFVLGVVGVLMARSVDIILGAIIAGGIGGMIVTWP